MTSAQANDDVSSTIEPTSSLAWADVIHADFQTVMSHHLQNISTYLFCTAERMLRTIIMENSRLIRHAFLSKSTRFESTDFASVMIDDVGCSRRHQCPQCGDCNCDLYNIEEYNLVEVHRPSKIGGRIGIFIRNDIPFQTRNDLIISLNQFLLG